MSGFHEIRFPLRLAIGATGGPERRTEVLALASGREVRNAVWGASRRRWDVGGAVSQLAGLHELSTFFEARMGRLFGFRFRDPMDFASAPPGTPVTEMDQVIGAGNDVTAAFALVKDYGGVLRTISKPVAGTIRVAVDGVELANGWSVNVTTGTVTFDVAPGDGAVVTAGFEFDCAVRFESDRLESVVEAIGAGRAVSIGLVELI